MAPILLSSRMAMMSEESIGICVHALVVMRLLLMRRSDCVDLGSLWWLGGYTTCQCEVALELPRKSM